MPLIKETVERPVKSPRRERESEPASKRVSEGGELETKLKMHHK